MFFFSAKQSSVKVRKIHKLSDSYHKSFRNNLNLNLLWAKKTPYPPGLIGLSMLLGTLGASLLGNLLTGKVTIRAGEEQLDQVKMLNATPC